MHVMPRRVDRCDLARHEDLRAEPSRLLQCAACQLAPGDAGREAEVVLDPRGRPRLPAGCLALDDDRPQSFRCPVDGSRKSGWTRADDHGVVLRSGRLRLEAEELGHPAQSRPHDGLPCHDAKGGIVAVHRERTPPLLGLVRHIGLEPPESDLVSVEEVPQLGTGGVPLVTEHDRPVGRRLGDEALQAARPGDPVAREPADSLADGGGDRHDRVVVVWLDPEDTRRLCCAEACGLRRTQRDRDLPEHIAGAPVADHTLDAVDDPDRLHPPFEETEERRLVPFVNGELPGTEADVGCDAAEAFPVCQLEVGKHGHATDLLRRHHPRHHPGRLRRTWTDSGLAITKDNATSSSRAVRLEECVLQGFNAASCGPKVCQPGQPLPSLVMRAEYCRIERWRGYFSSSFYVRLPDGTLVESKPFRWRRAAAAPDEGPARAAYEALAARIEAAGWTRHAQGASWFATTFTRLVEDRGDVDLQWQADPLPVEPPPIRALLPVYQAPPEPEPPPVRELRAPDEPKTPPLVVPPAVAPPADAPVEAAPRRRSSVARAAGTAGLARAPAPGLPPPQRPP